MKKQQQKQAVSVKNQCYGGNGLWQAMKKRKQAVTVKNPCDSGNDVGLNDLGLSKADLDVATAFNLWMADYEGSPEKYEREFKTVMTFVKERSNGETPSYGVASALILREFVRVARRTRLGLMKKPKLKKER